MRKASGDPYGAQDQCPRVELSLPEGIAGSEELAAEPQQVVAIEITGQGSRNFSPVVHDPQGIAPALRRRRAEQNRSRPQEWTGKAGDGRFGPARRQCAPGISR